MTVKDGKITLKSGQFGWDYVIENRMGDTVLVQSDQEYGSVASSFGWDGDPEDLEGAAAYLDECADSGDWVDDPGYF